MTDRPDLSAELQRLWQQRLDRIAEARRNRLAFAAARTAGLRQRHAAKTERIRRQRLADAVGATATDPTDPTDEDDQQ
jgi:hypothetical protein